MTDDRPSTHGIQRAANAIGLALLVGLMLAATTPPAPIPPSRLAPVGGSTPPSLPDSTSTTADSTDPSSQPETAAAGPPKRPPVDPRRTALLASEAIAAGDMERAEALLVATLEQAPEDAVSRYNLGVVLATSGRHDEARASFRRAAEDGDEALARRALFNLGSVAMRDGVAIAKDLLTPADPSSGIPSAGGPTPPPANTGPSGAGGADAEAAADPRAVAIAHLMEAFETFADVALADPDDRAAREAAERCARLIAALDPEQDPRQQQQQQQQQSQENQQGEREEDPQEGEESTEQDGQQGEEGDQQQGDQGEQGQQDQQGQQGQQDPSSGQQQGGEPGDQQQGQQGRGEQPGEPEQKNSSQSPDRDGKDDPNQKGELKPAESESESTSGSGAEGQSEPRDAATTAQGAGNARTIQLTPEQVDRLLQGVRDRERARLLQQEQQRRRRAPTSGGRNW